MLRKVTLVLIACLMLSGLAHAQATGQRRPRAQDYVIRGKIVFDTPHPPEHRIEIRLERTGRQLIDTVYSDSIGNFMFRNILPEIYYIGIEVEGFKPVRERVELSSSFNRVANLYLFLESEPVIVRKDSGRFDGDPKVVDVNELRTNYPKKAIQEYERALRDVEKGNVKKAISRLEKAVKMAPSFYQAQNNLGVQYKSLGRYRDSEHRFRLTRELNPNTAQPLINLGSMFLEEGEKQIGAGQEAAALATYQKAVKSLEEAIGLDSLSARARYYLGSALYKTASFERSETMLTRALELDEDLHAVRLMLVNLYIKQVRYQDALDQLTTFLKRNPNSPQAGAVANMKQQIEKALHN